MTEILFQLGAGAVVVGTSSYSRFPPEARQIPTVGGASSISLERVIRIGPRVVFGDEQATPARYFETLERFGIKTRRFGLQSVDGMLSAGVSMATALDRKDAAARWRNALTCFRALPRAAPFTFLILAWADPIIVYGPRTFLSDLLTRFGGKNLAPDGQNRFPPLSEEHLAVRPPTKIFFPTSQERAVERLASRWWPDVQRIPMDENLFSRASLTPLRHLGQLDTEWGDHAKRCLP